MSHLSLLQVRVIFRLMGGVGGWFLGNVPLIPPLGQGYLQVNGRGGWVVSGECPTYPSLRLGVSLGLWEGWVGGFWGMSHLSLPQVRVIFRLMGGVGGWFLGMSHLSLLQVRVIFRLMGGVGGWFLGNVPPIPPLGQGYLQVYGRGGWVVSGECPTYPSLRLGLSFGLWEGWVGGFWGMSPLSLPQVRVIFRLMRGVGGWFLGNVPPIPPLGQGYLQVNGRGGWVVSRECPTYPSLRLGLSLG